MSGLDLPDQQLSYAHMIGSLRVFLDRVAGARPGSEESTELGAALDALSARLQDCQVDEQAQLFGRVPVQGRAQVMLPQFFIDSRDDDSVTGHFTFSRFYLGSNGAAHGGSLPLILDEVLGWMASGNGRAGARTAYLNVNFRSIARIGNELVITARFVKEEGRTRFVTAEIHDGDVLAADAEALFVELRPGQP